MEKPRFQFSVDSIIPLAGILFNAAVLGINVPMGVFEWTLFIVFLAAAVLHEFAHHT